MAKICGKWRKYFTKWLICGKCLRDLGNGKNIWELAEINGARLKYLRNRYQHVENDLISEISLSGKRIK